MVAHSTKLVYKGPCMGFTRGHSRWYVAFSFDFNRLRNSARPSESSAPKGWRFATEKFSFSSANCHFCYSESETKCKKTYCSENIALIRDAGAKRTENWMDLGSSPIKFFAATPLTLFSPGKIFGILVRRGAIWPPSLFQKRETVRR